MGLRLKLNFWNIVTLHIKLKETMHTSNESKYFGHKHTNCTADSDFFLKIVMLHIKLKEMECKALKKANIMSLSTPVAPGMGSKGQILFSFLKMVMCISNLREGSEDKHAS